jgi:hypothetical protein
MANIRPQLRKWLSGGSFPLTNGLRATKGSLYYDDALIAVSYTSEETMSRIIVATQKGKDIIKQTRKVFIVPDGVIRNVLPALRGRDWAWMRKHGLPHNVTDASVASWLTDNVTRDGYEYRPTLKNNNIHFSAISVANCISQHQPAYIVVVSNKLTDTRLRYYGMSSGKKPSYLYSSNDHSEIVLAAMMSECVIIERSRMIERARNFYGIYE